MNASRQDFEAWLSPTVLEAPGALEAMAQRASAAAARHFGRVIQLYTPLYLSNYCENLCVYCGFHAGAAIPRRQLTLEEAALELKAIYQMGIREVLLLTGEHSKLASVTYIAGVARLAREIGFKSVGVEVYPMSTEDYRVLRTAGINSLSLYQETYNRERYSALHLKGPKADYDWRLGGPARAAAAGFSQINIGALLGLGPIDQELMALYAHLEGLMRTYPAVEWGVSLPRLQEATDWAKGHGEVVDDRRFVQALLALRLAFPRVSIAISTRESHQMRRHLIPLGINKLSAGVRTTVGGYALAALRENAAVEPTTTAGHGVQQFPIRDQGSVAGVAAMVSAAGYQPVFSDWLSE